MKSKPAASASPGKGSPAPAKPTSAAAAAAAAAAPVEKKQSSNPVKPSADPASSSWRLLAKYDHLVLAALFVVALIVFASGLNGGLVFDDHLAIQRNNDAAWNGTPLKAIFHHDFWGHDLADIASNGSFRPLTVLTFRVQHWIMHLRHVPLFLHLFNYLLAYLNACLVYYVARVYSFPLHLSRSAINVYGLPGLAALLFLVHPVHVDSVTSIVGRCELLYCFFGLCAFFCVHFFLNHDAAVAAAAMKVAAGGAAKKGTSSAVGLQRGAKGFRNGLIRAQYVMMCISFMATSVLCKDSGITFTAIFAIHAGLMYYWKRCSRTHAIAIAVLAFGQLVAYFLFRRYYVGEVDLSRSNLIRRSENPQYFIPPGYFHWIGIRLVIQMKNLELLFTPRTFCCEYSYNCIPHLSGMDDPRLPTFLAITAFWVITVMALTHRVLHRRSPLALVLLAFLLWIAIPYAPVSHLFVRVGTFIAERCLYVPSIGAVLFITYGALYVASPNPRYTAGLLLALAVWWGWLSYSRNPAWNTDRTLFESAVEVCPTSGKAHYQLAAAVTSDERSINEKVVQLARRAYELDNEFKEAMYYMAAYAWEMKNPQEAYEKIQECVRSPFGITMCYPLYHEMRSILFPNLKDSEKELDDARLLPLPAQQASRFYMAGLTQIKQEDTPCLAVNSLQEALKLWNSTGIYWYNDQVERSPDKATYCNGLYWYASAAHSCYLEPAAETETEEQKEDPNRHRPLTAKVLKKTLTTLSSGSRVCLTDWREPGLWDVPRWMLATYRPRLMQYTTIVEASLDVVQRMNTALNKSPLGKTKPSSLNPTAVISAVMVFAMERYCNSATICHNDQVRMKAAEYFGNDVRGACTRLHHSRQEWIKEVTAYALVLQQLNADKTAWITPEIQTLAACSPDLSFVVA